MSRALGGRTNLASRSTPIAIPAPIGSASSSTVPVYPTWTLQSSGTVAGTGQQTLSASESFDYTYDEAEWLCAVLGTRASGSTTYIPSLYSHKAWAYQASIGTGASLLTVFRFNWAQGTYNGAATTLKVTPFNSGSHSWAYVLLRCESGYVNNTNEESEGSGTVPFDLVPTVRVGGNNGNGGGFNHVQFVATLAAKTVTFGGALADNTVTETNSAGNGLDAGWTDPDHWFEDVTTSISGSGSTTAWALTTGTYGH